MTTTRGVQGGNLQISIRHYRRPSARPPSVSFLAGALHVESCHQPWIKAKSSVVVASTSPATVRCRQGQRLLAGPKSGCSAHGSQAKSLCTPALRYTWRSSTAAMSARAESDSRSYLGVRSPAWQAYSNTTHTSRQAKGWTTRQLQRRHATLQHCGCGCGVCIT
jgi:hypothetical protein